VHAQEVEPTSAAIAMSTVPLMSDSNIPGVGSLLANVISSVTKRHTTTVSGSFSCVSEKKSIVQIWARKGQGNKVNPP